MHCKVLIVFIMLLAFTVKCIVMFFYLEINECKKLEFKISFFV